MPSFIRITSKLETLRERLGPQDHSLALPTVGSTPLLQHATLKGWVAQIWAN
jgi:hypothetical protein